MLDDRNFCELLHLRSERSNQQRVVVPGTVCFARARCEVRVSSLQGEQERL
jgi:hypothetical protein